MQKYLKFIDQVRQLNKKFDLSPHEIELLDIAANAHFSKQPLVIGSLVSQRSVASQATLHSVLKRLLNKKLLSTQCLVEDRRLKRVALTKLALEHYKRLHNEINRVTT